MLEIQRGACIQNGRVCFSSQVTFPLTKMAQAGKTRPFIFVFGKWKSGQTPKYSTAFWRRQLRVCCLTGGMLPVRTRGRRSRAWADLSVAYILKSLNNQVHNIIPCQLGELQSGSGPHLDLQSLPGAPPAHPRAAPGRDWSQTGGSSGGSGGGGGGVPCLGWAAEGPREEPPSAGLFPG